MKVRTVPFGYRYSNGTVIEDTVQSNVLRKIFEDYIGGSSLQNIADMLNTFCVEYRPNVYGWNKARLMRLLEDRRYTGGDAFPPLITSECFEQALEIKLQRNTQKKVDRSDTIYSIDVPVICPCCGSQMRRRADARLKNPRWICRDEQCHTIIEISDEHLLGEINGLLNRLIDRPQMVCADSEPDMRPDAASQKLDNEIGHSLDSQSFDKDGIRNMIFESIARRYSGIDTIPFISRQLVHIFEKAEHTDDYSPELPKRTIKSICLHMDAAVGIVLINDRYIGKERTDGTDS